MTTDFRALCAELVATWDDSSLGFDFEVDFSDAVAGLVERVRAALAEPEGPTREEAVAVYSEVMVTHECQTLGDMAEHFARAVLARWGRPAPQPVPVSERLPGPEDCDAEGECYWFDPEGSGAWYQDIYQGNYTHWLPVHALPQPS